MKRTWMTCLVALTVLGMSGAPGARNQIAVTWQSAPTLNGLPMDVTALTTLPLPGGSLNNQIIQFNGQLQQGNNLVITPSTGAFNFGAGANLRVNLQNPSGGNLLPALGRPSITQSVPAAQTQVIQNQNFAQPSWGSTPTSNPVNTGPNYSLAVSKPDFSFKPGSLKYVKEATSDMGQIDMAIAPGLQPGRVRYVPVGEF